MEITIEDVLKDRELLSRVLKGYNAKKAKTIKYYEKNK